MEITNLHNLPESIVNAVKKTIYKPTYDLMRVTELIGAPLVKELTIKNWKEIKVDVSDYLWNILGQAIHHILEEGAPKGAEVEKRHSFTIGDTTISGKVDLYSYKGIEDWKTTSVFSFLLGMKKEWEAQQNVYKFVWEHNKLPVPTLVINAILRDWQRSKAKFDMTYPQIPFLSVDVPMWSKPVITEYIFDRIAMHAQRPFLECTDEEKWKRPTTYAVTKPQNKRATKVCDTKKEAEEYIEDKKEQKPKDMYIIDVRQGLCVKCEDYCIVRDFCPYYKKGEL